MPTVLQIADEFIARYRRGEHPRAEEYYERYPDVAEELRSYLPVVTVMEQAVLAETNSIETVDADVDGTMGDPVDVELPERLGRYRIIKRIGQGSMGAVYLAYDTQLQRNVALKVPNLSRHDSSSTERFYREARAMASVEHPGLCPVYDVGEIDGKHVIAMGFVDGVSLSEVLRETPRMDELQAAQLIRDIASAVHVAHEAGIIHRDLKPANVMLRKRHVFRSSSQHQPSTSYFPDTGEPVVMDFGLAWRSQEDNAELTQDGAIVGTPSYMSPEQIRAGSTKIGSATDIYAVGVIMYRLLCGRCPFEGPVLSILNQIAHQQPAKPSSYAPGIAASLEGICLKAMAKQPEDRYGSAAELAEALDAFLNQRVKTAPTTNGFNTRSGVATVFLALFVFAAVATWLIKTPYGDVFVHAPENIQVEVALIQNGKVVQIVGPADDWSVRIGQGIYEVSLRPMPGTNAADAARLSVKDGNRVTVSRGGRADITIVYRPSDKDAESGAAAEPLTITKVDKTERPDTSHLLPPIPVPSAASSGRFTDSGQRLGESDSKVIRLGDLDGDGDLDAFVGCYDPPENLVWLNDGSGRFTDSGQRLGTQGTFAVTLGDVDGDGDFDVVAGSRDPQARAELWLNSGDGTFNEVEQKLAAGHHGALGDLDQDGDLDLFLSRMHAPNRVYWNDGAGHFADSGQGLGAVSSLYAALGDLDDDGDLDAYVCNNYNTKNVVYRNDGTGRFEEWAQAQMAGETAMAEMLDWNSDGQLDVVLGRWGHLLEIQLNDGEGGLNHFAFGDLTFPYTGVRAADLDGDQAPDVLFVGSVFQPLPFGVIRHGPEQHLGEAEFFGQMKAAFADIGDLDGDGDLDVFVANHSRAPDQVWLNGNAGESERAPFVQSEQSLPAAHSRNAVVADLDGDEDLDIFLPNEIDQIGVWLNDGGGHFVEQGQHLELPGAVWPSGGDLDGDGDVDVLVTTSNAVDTVCVNDGAGRFSRFDLEPIAGVKTRNVLADVDSDGDLDAIVVVQDGNDVLLLNDGQGRFVGRKELVGQASRDCAVGDIDNDGDVDILVSSDADGETLRIWLGDGKGDFSRSGLAIPRVHAGVSLADLNDDGSLDLVTSGNVIGNSPQQISFGTGAGEFVPSGQPLAALVMNNAVSGDIDMDGDTDLIIANRHSSPNQLLLNDGEGAFQHAQWMGSSNSFVEIADLDADGDLDIVEVVYSSAEPIKPSNGNCRIWFNQTVTKPAR